MRPVIAVANQLIQLAQADQVVLTGAQLQALLYLSHGLRVASVNKPLLDEPLLALRDGVTIASLNRMGIVAGRPVKTLLAQIVPSADGGKLRERVLALKPDDPVRPLVERTWQRYRPLSAYELSVFLRCAGSPWDQVWNDPARLTGGLQTAPSGVTGEDSERAAIIPDALVRRWFRQQLIQEQKAQAAAEGLERTMDVSSRHLEETISAVVEPELRSL
ncbi:MAG: hypothetical protein Q8Q73_13905 [Stagnimonas sp.]|nr:hypothetical protein [Stagnimonas sp.]